MGLPGRGERAAQARLNPDSGATSLPVGGGYAVFMGAGSPLSQVQGMGLFGPVDDEELERMEAFYRERGSPVQSGARLAGGGVAAAALEPPRVPGLSSRRTCWCGRSAAGAPRPRGGQLATSRPTPRATEVEVAPVRPDEVVIWAESVLRCFFPDPAELPRPLLEGAIAMASIPAVSCWLARVDGRIAGGGALVIHNGLALICGDGTLPEFRSQGVQTALLRARLDHARRSGCDLAVICTQPGSSSQRNAERQGFQVVYARTLMGRE